MATASLTTGPVNQVIPRQRDNIRVPRQQLPYRGSAHNRARTVSDHNRPAPFRVMEREREWVESVLKQAPQGGVTLHSPGTGRDWGIVCHRAASNSD